MIADKDRKGYFGASDTDKIVGNWSTKTWIDWWLVKEGIKRNNITTVAMQTGTFKEHQILQFVDADIEMDKQIIIPELCLRVNLDGNVGKHIYECKTHKADKPYSMPKSHYNQVLVQMFAFDTKEAEIVSYALSDDDYVNYFLPIDPERLKHHSVDYNKSWIEDTYIPRITYLSECLKKGIMPNTTMKF